MFKEDSDLFSRYKFFIFHNIHLHCLHHREKRYLYVQPGETVQKTRTGTRIGKDLWMVRYLKNINGFLRDPGQYTIDDGFLSQYWKDHEKLQDCL